MSTAHGGSACGGNKFRAEKAVGADAAAQTRAAQLSPCAVAVLRAMEHLANARSECSPSMLDLAQATN
jgi:hypothetical protein